jgi:hypothetical protein
VNNRFRLVHRRERAVQPIAGQRFLDEGFSHPWSVGTRRLQSPYFRDNPGRRPVFSVEVIRDVIRVSVDEEKNTPDTPPVTLDERGQATEVIRVVVGQGDERDMTDAYRMEPVGQPVPVGADID